MPASRFASVVSVPNLTPQQPHPPLNGLSEDIFTITTSIAELNRLLKRTQDVAVKSIQPRLVTQTKLPCFRIHVEGPAKQLTRLGQLLTQAHLLLEASPQT
ncbi:MAG: hypothetical protein VKK59_04975 [Vampirovibrionales bacterium]|nr:hypothetical protein [Vampirovibrionales bacterium]